MLGCISGLNFEILTSISCNLSRVKVKNGDNFFFTLHLNLILKIKVNEATNNGDHNQCVLHLLSQCGGSGTGDELSCGHTETHTDNTRRPKQTSAKKKSSAFTHLPLKKMAAISQTTFSNAFPWMNIFVFWFEFHWSVFVGVQLPIFQHLFG